MFLRPACARTRRLLWDPAESLPAAEELQHHLRRCSACAREAAAIRQSHDYLTAGRLEPIALPVAGWSGVRERIADAAPAVAHRPQLPLRHRALAGLCLGTLLLAAAWGAQLLLPERTSEGTVRPSVAVHTSAPPQPPAATPQASPSDPKAGPGPGLQRVAAGPDVESPNRPEAPPKPEAPVDDLEYVNLAPDPADWTSLDDKAVEALRQRVDRSLKTGDDFIEIPFPRVAATGGQGAAGALAAYAKEKAVVDPRLARTVNLALKGSSFSELCAALSERTSVRFTAARAVADQKVVLFCRDQPAREVMRRISGHFGFTWMRSRAASGEAGDYRYELTQSLRAQLTEEELRNQELNAALLSLDADLRKPLPPAGSERLPEEGQLSQRERAAQRLLRERHRWAGAIQLYTRLSPGELAALRNGQTVEYSTEAERAERRLPDDLRLPLLQAHGPFRHYTASGELTNDGLALAEVPSAGVSVEFSLEQREPGRLSLRVEPHWTLMRDGQRIPVGGRLSAEIGLGEAPAVRPDNAVHNRKLRKDPVFQRRISLEPEWSCPVLKKHGIVQPAINEPGLPFEERLARRDLPPMPHVDSADVWEAVHRATGLPVLTDYNSALYSPAVFARKNEPAFDALCRAGDALRTRWRKEGEFLTARSTTYLWDKLQEVPARLLERWRRQREERGETALSDLLEMATLSELQLNSHGAAQKIRHCWGLEEWSLLVRNPNSARGIGAGNHRLMRALAGMPPALRDRAFSPAGMALAQLPAQYQTEVVEALQQWNYQPLRLAESRIRVEFIPAGRWLWHTPHSRYDTEAFFALPLASGKTAEDALAAARRIDPATQPGEIHRTRGVLAVYVHYDGRLTSQGRPY